MALLVLLGCLMCNVLLAWATLQQPYFSRTLSSLPPRNPNKWTHSIIFEPQPQIQLTCSSYKVTSFLDFQPFLQGFQNVKNYLDQLWIDIQNLYHFQYLFVPTTPIPMEPTINYSHIEKFLTSTLCVKHPYDFQA